MNIEDKNHSMSSDELQSVYFDKDALKTEPRKIYRMEMRGDRRYYTLDEMGIPTFYPSVTTVIKWALPTSPFLIDWKVNMGKEAADDYRDERAAFGTFMHGIFADLLIAGTYDLDQMEDQLTGYLERNRYPITWLKWIFELQSATLAFAQWVKDYEVKPLAIEIALASDKMGIAGMLDLPCVLTITEEVEEPTVVTTKESGFFGETYQTNGKWYKKGDPKKSTRETQTTVLKKVKRKIERRAIVDFKSGSNFFEDHEIQLLAYREIWNENFPNDKVEYLFNWAPNAWRGTKPTYKFKDQSESKRIRKLWPILEIAKIESASRERTITILSGVIDLKEPIERNIQEMDYTQAIILKHTKSNDNNGTSEESPSDAGPTESILPSESTEPAGSRERSGEEQGDGSGDAQDMQGNN